VINDQKNNQSRQSYKAVSVKLTRQNERLKNAHNL